MRGTMMELIGFLPAEVRKERVVAKLPFRDDLTQLTGLLHAEAILTLAVTAATILANQNTVHASIHEQKKGGKLGDTFWGYAR